MSNLVLFSYGSPDLMMAGAAVFALLCGIVLMVGRSVVGPPLRLLSNLRRSLHREPVVCLTFPIADRLREQNVHNVQRPMRRAA